MTKKSNDSPKGEKTPMTSRTSSPTLTTVKNPLQRNRDAVGVLGTQAYGMARDCALLKPSFVRNGTRR